MQLLQWLSCLKAGNTPHAVFLVGPAGSGKKEYARRAAALYLLGREDTEKLTECPFFQELPDYAVKTVRACCEELNRQVFARGRRCLVIPDAHKLTPQTQNALLKTLEEPPEDALLILTGNEQAVLPTIRSRCMLVRVGSEDRAKLAARLSARGVAPDRATLAAALSDGVPSLAERYAGEEYMAFRAQALPVIEEALFGVTPFSQAAALLERREDGKKKVGKDGLCDFIDMLLSLLRDALLQQLGDSDSRNLDAQALQNRVAGHFTTAEIQCMIAETLQKRRALTEYGGAPSLVLDALLASIRKREK
jgi:DNA polymerase-3 subunit delta'